MALGRFSNLFLGRICGEPPHSCRKKTMSQKESRRSRKIMEALRREGWFCFKVHGTEFVMAGLPDVIVCADGRFIGLETKEPEKRSNTSVRQDFVHSLIREAGGTAVVVTSPAEAVEVVRRALA